MTNEERVEQLRALHDAQAFERKVVKRTPRNLHDDFCTLECGHTGIVPRRHESWECRECRKPFEPDAPLPPAARPRHQRLRWWAPVIIPLLFLLWFVMMLPGWIAAGNEREREYEQLKQRVSQAEERLKPLEGITK